MSTTEESFSGTTSPNEPESLDSNRDAARGDEPAQTRSNFPTTFGATPPRDSATSRRTGSNAAMFIAGIAVLGGLLAWLWAANQGERYSATASVQIQPASTIEESRDVVDIVESLDRGTIVVTAAGLADSGLVHTGAQERLGLTAAQVEDYEVESVQVLTSHLVDITVTGPNEARAIAYADAIADELSTTFTTSYPVYQMSTVTPAAIPDSSGRPGIVLIVIAAMIASAIAALMLWLALFGGSDERTDLPLARRA